MKNKISIYLFSTKIKYILSTLFFISLFIQIINILEVAKIIENNNSNIISILYLSFLKLPTTMLEIIPFVVIISTAFFYRSLISTEASLTAGAKKDVLNSRKGLSTTRFMSLEKFSITS